MTNAPIADDFAAIDAAGRGEDTPASEALATAEQYAALKFPAITSPPFTVGDRLEWLSDAADAFDYLVEGVLKLDDDGLEKAAAQDLEEGFIQLAEVLADLAPRLEMLEKAAKMAHLRLLCVLTRLEGRKTGEADR